VDRLCNAIVMGTPFVDLNNPSTSDRRSEPSTESAGAPKATDVSGRLEAAE
jgi:hypothetical protein